MKQTLNELVSDLRSDNPSQRSVDIASAFLMSIYCFYKGQPYEGVVNPLLPVSEVDECCINGYDNLEFSYLKVGDNLENAPRFLTNERILLFSHIDSLHEVVSAYSIIQKPNDSGLFLPCGRVDYGYMSYWLEKGYITFPTIDNFNDSDVEIWGDNYPLGGGVFYSPNGFNYLTQPSTLADYLEGIDKVDSGFRGVNGTLSVIAESYDKYL